MDSDIPSGETVIATVEGNFLDAVTKDKIEFYRGHTRTSFDYDVAKIDGKYYIYFQTLNKAQNNYSVVIKNVRYYVGAQISTAEISKNFSINSEIVDFYVDKGFIVTDGNFSLTVQNLNPSSITVDVNTETVSGSTGGFFDFLFKNEDIGSDETSIILLSGEIEKIDINLKDITETTTRIITLTSENTKYEIPAYVIASVQTTTNETQNDSSYEENDTVVETKNETDLGGSIWDLFKKENKTETENDSSGYEVVVGDDGNTTIIKDGNIISNNTKLKPCSDIGGFVCNNEEEFCDGDLVESFNGECCLGICSQKTSGSGGKIIGWIIIGFILILLIWFKIKFGRTKRKKIDLMDFKNKKF